MMIDLVRRRIARTSTWLSDHRRHRQQKRSPIEAADDVS